MDSENSKPSNSHWLLLNLSDKTNLKGSDKYVALSNLSIWKTQINFFLISTPTWNEELGLSNGWYSVS